jgi:hypothetical protein
MSRPVIDYSRTLRRSLADGKTLDQALSQLRLEGASILDCIATVRAFRRCELSEAKRLVESSAAWTDVRERTEGSFRALSKDENRDS